MPILKQVGVVFRNREGYREVIANTLHKTEAGAMTLASVTRL